MLAADLSAVDSDGFVVVSGALSASELDGIRAELEPHRDETRLLELVPRTRRPGSSRLDDRRGGRTRRYERARYSAS